jgi:hypothetical protein
LNELVERGLDFSTPRLYALDGAKAFSPAAQRHAAEAASFNAAKFIKKRKVADHLPDEHKANVKRKLQNACQMTDYADAKRASDRLHRELMDLRAVLEEGMEETLTVHKLRVPAQLIWAISMPVANSARCGGSRSHWATVGGCGRRRRWIRNWERCCGCTRPRSGRAEMRLSTLAGSFGVGIFRPAKEEFSPGVDSMSYQTE